MANNANTHSHSPYVRSLFAVIIFYLSSRVSSDIVLRAERAALNGSEKSESSRAHEYISRFFSPSTCAHDVITWRANSHGICSTRYRRIVKMIIASIRYYHSAIVFLSISFSLYLYHVFTEKIDITLDG